MYRFRSRWRLPAAPERCWADISAALRTPGASWWPGVQVEAALPELRVGETFVLAVRAPLGYVLRVRLVIARVELGRLLSAAATGDLAGGGTVVLAAASGGCEMSFEWSVDTQKAWMRATGWVMRPVFVACHAVVMHRGERALRVRVRAARGA